MVSPRRERFRAALLAAAALGATVACDNGVDPLATITVNVTPANDTLSSLGQSVQLSARAWDALGDRLRRAGVTWTSSNDSVASVNARGMVTATGNGVARIVGTVAEVADTALITVRQAVAGLSFRQGPQSVTAGDTLSPLIVWLLDSGYHVVTDTEVPVTLALDSNPGGATLGGTTTVTTVHGIATFSDLWMVKAANGYTLVATDPDRDSATSGGFSVLPGPPTLSFVTQPGTAEGNVWLNPPPQVAVGSDKFGNPFAEIYGAYLVARLAVSPTGDSLTSIAYLSNDVATFDQLTLPRPGDGFVLEVSGLGATPVSSNPFSVRLTFVRAVAGAHHSCGVTVAVYEYCWGANDAGQLGDGTIVQRLAPTPVVLVRYPQLTAAGDVTCGFANYYSGDCWGANETGQLGNGGTTGSPYPLQLPSLLNGTQLTWVAVSTGGLHSCGVIHAHLAYCWGSNTFGQLGDSSTTQRLSPVPVSDSLPFVQVSAGTSHTCGVTTTNAAYCWGANADGELGDSTTTDRLTPTPVHGSLTLLQLSAGDGYTCGLATDSTAYCWGTNAGGQLGDGTTQQRLQPTPVFGGLRFSDVSAGEAHTCGVATNGTAYCWGDNADGQLGDGSTSQRLQPTPVAGGLTFLQVSAGLAHTCGAATDSVAYCWGRNDRGQLGNGGTNQKLVPTPVVH